MRFKKTVLVFVLTATAVLSAAGNGYKLFQQGLAKERAEADLRGAIKIYEQVVQQSATDRKLAAQALFRMGECHRALGDSEARKAYERIVSDYADQKEQAAEAQARLAAMRAPADSGTLTFRRVWSGPKVDTEGSISKDGRYLSYPDWSTGNLALRDLLTGTGRALTNDGSSSEYAERSVISPDGTRVAFARFDGEDHYELRLADATGDAAAPSRPLYANQDDIWLAPNSWSPDGSWIAVQIQKKDGTALIGLVSAEDGSLKVLRSVDWRGPGKIAFSPDGEFIAYDLPADENALQRDVFVLAVDGSRETKGVVHAANDEVLGWSPDGGRVLFSSNRTGSIGLWSVGISNGKPHGDPALIKPDIGDVASLGITTKGDLYLGLRVKGPEVFVASFEFAEGKRLSDPVSPISEYVFTNRSPVWSPDGLQIAYLSRRNFPGSPDFRLGVLSTETGKIRELSLSAELTYAFRPRWSPDGRFIAVNGSDRKGRRGLFHVDTRTGASSLIVRAEPDSSIDGSDWSPDGKKVYYRRFVEDDDAALIERDLASGAERVVIRRSSMAPPDLSPDGKWIVIRAQHKATNRTSLLLVQVSDGETRELLGELKGFEFPAWAPDSRSVFLPQGGTEMLRIPVSQGEPRKLDLGINAEQLSIHPDGKRIAFVAGKNSFEVWALENFLAVQVAQK